MSTQTDLDVLILGHGLAGGLLAWHLIQKGLRVTVIDDPQSLSASRVAAGLFNPVTGQRLVKFKHADRFLPVARECYHALEKRFGKTFFHDMGMVRLIRSNHDQLVWGKRKNDPEYDSYLGEYSDRNTSPYVHDPLGSFRQHRTGYVDTTVLLDTLSEFFRGNDSFIDARIDYKEISFEKGQVTALDIRAKQIIFCEGYRATGNPWFSWLPFKPAKGEILALQTDTELPEQIINAGKWLLPSTEGLFKTGATYQWHELDELPTKEAKQELLDFVHALLRHPGNIKIIHHLAGIRPCTKDTKPYIGMHPHHPELGFFNGFGSRGSLMIPYHAEQFAAHLCDKTAIDKETDIKRYWKEDA